MLQHFGKELVHNRGCLAKQTRKTTTRKTLEQYQSKVKTIYKCCTVLPRIWYTIQHGGRDARSELKIDNLLLVQLMPSQPALQLHRYLLTRSVHEPWTQGLIMQSSISEKKDINVICLF